MPALSPQSHAQNILRLSHAMYHRAKQGDWFAFTELEVTRQKIIDALFAHPHIDVALEKLALILRQVMVIDNESISLGEREKQRLSQGMVELKQHQQAAQIYRLVSMN